MFRFPIGVHLVPQIHDFVFLGLNLQSLNVHLQPQTQILNFTRIVLNLIQTLSNLTP